MQDFPDSQSWSPRIVADPVHADDSIHLSFVCDSNASIANERGPNDPILPREPCTSEVEEIIPEVPRGPIKLKEEESIRDSQTQRHAERFERTRLRRAERFERTRFALRSMGGAAIGSATTTVGSSFFLLFCTLQVFSKLGSIAIAVTFLSILYALLPLPAILIEAGPLGSGTRGSIERIKNAIAPAQSRHHDQDYGSAGTSVQE
eukprot:gnl/MRDRNA2_/MRDRNA2_18149_c0_seq2.p1 gnl/MRDRNA2_/MRDRNA2_18149_c0~~gnl/MRDRNA2_/MRDRNA2_18149_c0_seq2.p1  ORF type:complete len:205 (-),score=19.70 gnl/MRDRNA2_/MRDRNA2_18149_c0_seq2:182-796(-)